MFYNKNRYNKYYIIIGILVFVVMGSIFSSNFSQQGATLRVLNTDGISISVYSPIPDSVISTFNVPIKIIANGPSEDAAIDEFIIEISGENGWNKLITVSGNIYNNKITVPIVNQKYAISIHVESDGLSGDDQYSFSVNVDTKPRITLNVGLSAAEGIVGEAITITVSWEVIDALNDLKTVEIRVLSLDDNKDIYSDTVFSGDKCSYVGSDLDIEITNDVVSLESEYKVTVIAKDTNNVVNKDYCFRISWIEDGNTVITTTESTISKSSSSDSTTTTNSPVETESGIDLYTDDGDSFSFLSPSFELISIVGVVLLIYKRKIGNDINDIE